MKKNSENINIPEKTTVPILSVILVALGTTLGAFGISQIMSVFTSFSSSFTSYLTESFSWDATVSGLVVGVAFLLFAIIAFKSSPKIKIWSNQIKNLFSSNVDTQPSNFYDLNVVPTEYFVDTMTKKRGCNVVKDPDGNGFVLYCPDYPTNGRMGKIISGSAGSFERGTKIAITIFLNIIIILPIIFIRDGTMDLQYGPWVWFIFLCGTIVVFYESQILPLWNLVIIYIMHTIIAMIISPETLMVIKIAVPGAIIFFGIALIMYIFQYDHCKTENNWWCDRM